LKTTTYVLVKGQERMSKYDGGTSTIYEKSTSAQIGGSNSEAMKNTGNQPTRVEGNMGMVSSS